MQASYMRFICAILFLAVFSSCANIVPPEGGAKDVAAPKLLSIAPQDSLLNTRVTHIDMRFDEFITVSDVGKEIKISPLLPFPLDATVNGRKVTVKIPDSLLKGNTTYRLHFGNAIKDLNEGNVFKDFSYMFSTGSYFDSLKLHGKVYDAATGKPAPDMYVILYDADSTTDSVVVKDKPMYVGRSDASGLFTIPGLPSKAFRIYALKDDDDNLVYGGDNEMIAFVDSIFYPKDSTAFSDRIELRMFKEVLPPDSIDKADSVQKGGGRLRGGAKRRSEKIEGELRYSVSVDTTDTEKRVHDINKPVKITFTNAVDTYSKSRMFLSYDSTGIDVETDFTLERDTVPEALLFNTDWKENTLYTVRILKDFVTDTSKTMSMPSKYIFRTKSADDYGILKINVAGKYKGKKYLLQVLGEKDTIHRKPLIDTAVTLNRLLPGKYTMAIIVDENGNGKWDTGDLLAKLQPEMVIPYTEEIELKAGWENVIDFKEPVSEDPSLMNRKGRLKASGAAPPPAQGEKTENK